MPITALVTERRTGRQFARGESSQRMFDITGADDENDALALLADQKSVSVGSADPMDDSLTVPGGGIKLARSGRVWVASVAYSGPFGISLGEGTETDELLAHKWRVSVDPASIEEPIDHDAGGRPLIYSNSLPILGLTRGVPIVTITMWRWESSYDLQKHLDYANRYNSDSVVLPKVGTAAPGQVFIRSIKLKEEVSADAGVVAVVYTFESRPNIVIQPGSVALHGFYRRILDSGAVGYTATGFNHITYKTGGDIGKPVSVPVLLDGFGAPLDSDSYNVGGGDAFAISEPPALLDVTEDGVFLMYDLTDGPIAFSGLDIGANL